VSLKTAAKTGHGHTLHVNDFKKMIVGANIFFEREKEAINALNVFPVPDGDTGTNMSMTLNAAVEGSLSYKGKSIGELSEIVASSALMGARGNSGVILSQILRGIARGLRNKEHISPAELSKAFQYGVVYAYKAVSTPVEGTILTVAREMARGIRSAVHKGDNLYGSMEEAIKTGRIALAKTTEMLPALKEAGVVDAGGLGLLVFLEGCLYALKRSLSDMLVHKPLTDEIKRESPAPLPPFFPEKETFNLKYPYCTELIIKADTESISSLEQKMSAYGDSLIIAADSRAVKVHIHTASPGLVLQTALEFGTLHNIKIDNMSDQLTLTSPAAGRAETPVILPGNLKHEKGESGIISVSFGEGFREIFLSLGADEIVYGGQTMNPNVEDLLRAVETLPQQSALILPNNKNIIMVAEQVKNLTTKQVEVLETRSLPEGLAALLAYNPALPVEENVAKMLEGYNRVKTGLLTYATRDTVVRGSDIRTGHFLGLSGDDIVSSGDNLNRTAQELLNMMITEDDDIITLFYGHDVSRKEASILVDFVENNFPDLEIELRYGGQPIYYYIFSIE
jgi:uncharacterized protein